MTKQPRTLRDVALIAKDRHDGAGGRKLALVAKERKHSVSYGTIDSILAGTYTRKPSIKTLKALAYLADIPEAQVFEIAGMRAPSVSVAEQLPEGVDELGPDERQMLIEIARGLIRQTRREQKLIVALRQAQESGHDERTEEDVTEPRTQGTYPSAISRAGVSPAHVDASAEGEVPAVPRPDEYALAASDEPSEGRALREQQDAAAEGSQDTDHWEDA